MKATTLDGMIARAIVGTGRAGANPPTTMEGLTKSIEARMGLGKYSRADADRRAGAAAGVSGRTWQAWRLGQRKNVPPALVARYRRANLSGKRETHVREGLVVCGITVRISDKDVEQKCHVGRFMASHKKNPREINPELVDRYLDGGESTGSILRSYVQAYCRQFGATLVSINSVDMRGDA